MGRKKITLTKLTDPRSRQVTFSKRKFGLFKKSYELSLMCGCDIAVILISSNNKLYQYSSENMESTLMKYSEWSGKVETKTADEVEKLVKKGKERSPEVTSPNKWAGFDFHQATNKF